MDKFYELLDASRLGSLITLVGVLGALIALATGQITYPEFTLAIAASGIGGGAIGIARNGAGHGTSRQSGPDALAEVLAKAMAPRTMTRGDAGDPGRPPQPTSPFASRRSRGEDTPADSPPDGP